jgi:hypothetical protein
MKIKGLRGRFSYRSYFLTPLIAAMTLSCHNFAQGGCGRFQPITMPAQIQNRVDKIVSPGYPAVGGWKTSIDCSSSISGLLLPLTSIVALG